MDLDLDIIKTILVLRADLFLVFNNMRSDNAIAFRPFISQNAIACALSYSLVAQNKNL